MLATTIVQIMLRFQQEKSLTKLQFLGKPPWGIALPSTEAQVFRIDQKALMKYWQFLLMVGTATNFREGVNQLNRQMPFRSMRKRRGDWV